jgi:general secretion pathway protein I
MKPERPNGFTLVEMLVALSVFSLAALAIIRLQSYTIHNGAEIADRVSAQSVVRNRSVEILTDPNPPPLGRSSGQERNGGRNWQWVQEAQLSEDGKFVQIALSASAPDTNARASLNIVRVSAALAAEDFGK